MLTMLAHQVLKNADFSAQVDQNYNCNNTFSVNVRLIISLWKHANYKVTVLNITHADRSLYLVIVCMCMIQIIDTIRILFQAKFSVLCCFNDSTITMAIWTFDLYYSLTAIFTICYTNRGCSTMGPLRVEEKTTIRN